jgi:hypothetical protein
VARSRRSGGGGHCLARSLELGNHPQQLYLEGVWWYTFVIQATQEAEAGRLKVQAQLGLLRETLSKKKKKKKKKRSQVQSPALNRRRRRRGKEN